MRLGLCIGGASTALFARAPTRALAQATSSFDSLAARAEQASGRFVDRRVAAGDGYRRIGADFPGMGEHWLNPDVLLRGKLDPDRPTLLIYATINGKPTLLGLGFVAVTHGDSVPSSLPGWPRDWHEHSGLLSDESGAGHHDAPADGTHVWVSHVWTTLTNPNGRYTPDNWGLPFVRAGLSAPASVDADAGRAMSLIVGGDEYLRAVLTDAELRSPHNAVTVDSMIAAARKHAAVIAVSAGSSGVVSDGDVAALRAIWRGLQNGLRSALGPRIDELLAPPHAVHAMHQMRDHAP